MTVPPSSLAEAARLIRDGRLVAFPTETVYGLGADATAPDAVALIFAAKGRPRFNPLIAHVASLAAAAAEGVLSADAVRLAEAFWPGPLTLVVPRSPGGAVCDLACAGLASVGLRVPAHPLALELLRTVKRPVAAPSANRSGRLSPTTPADVASELGEAVDLVLDGGACRIGIESTIVGIRGAKATLLRPGGIAREAIEAVLGRPLGAPGTGIAAPGMLASHYAPHAALRLDATRLEPGELGLDFADTLPGAALDLSANGDLAEAAANLYGHLRSLDAQAPDRIAVAPIPEAGLGAGDLRPLAPRSGTEGNRVYLILTSDVDFKTLAPLSVFTSTAGSASEALRITWLPLIVFSTSSVWTLVTSPSTVPLPHL